MDIIEFINNSSFERPIIATYKQGTLISRGEGGNRHLFFIDHPITNAEREDAYNPYRSIKGEHIWIDTHIWGKHCCFVNTYTKYGEVERALNDTAEMYCLLEDTYYFTTEDIERFICALVGIAGGVSGLTIKGGI